MSALELALGCWALVGLVAVHARVLRQRDPALLATCLLLDLVFAGLTLVAWLDPPLFRRWMQEDGWVEWATCFAFLAAGLLALGEVRRRLLPPRSPLARLALAGLALFCLFVAGEEISWGQRLLAFEPPAVFLEHNFQQELNLHNFLKDKQLAGFELDSRFLVALIAVLYGIAAPLLLRARRWESHPLARALRAAAPALALSPYFALIALVELTYPVKLAGEAAELGLGLLFLVDGVGRRWGGQPATTALRLAAAGTLIVALAVITPATLQWTLYGSDPERGLQAGRDLAQLQRDLERGGVIRAKLYHKGRVHKRLFSAIRASYFALGPDSEFLQGRATPADPAARSPRRDRRGYFLDPWNNPYWVHKSRRGWITLYSFGANRRRDGPVGRLRAGTLVAGDDIARRFRPLEATAAR